MSEQDPPLDRTSKLRELDSLRGVAALGVLFFHYSGHFHANPLASIFGALYRSGSYSVDFFFVLSGLVLARAYGSDARRGRLAENSVKRIARMMPLHIATLVLVAGAQYVLVVFMGRPSFIVGNNDLYHLLLNVGLAQYVGFQDGFSFNAPSWSISTEFYVNISFFVLLAHSRRVVPTSVLVVIVSFVMVVGTGTGSLVGADTVRYPSVTMFRTLLGFFVGVLLFEVVFRRTPWRRSIAPLFDLGFALTVAILFLGASGGLKLHRHLEMLSVLIGFPALIFCASYGRFAKSVLRLRPLTYLGDISFSIYMIHFPIQIAFHMLGVAGWVRFEYRSPTALFVFLGVTLALASLSYHTLELPSQRWINRWWRARAAGTQPE